MIKNSDYVARINQISMFNRNRDLPEYTSDKIITNISKRTRQTRNFVTIRTPNSDDLIALRYGIGFIGEFGNE